jgi:endoglucanase
MEARADAPPARSLVATDRAASRFAGWSGLLRHRICCVVAALTLTVSPLSSAVAGSPEVSDPQACEVPAASGPLRPRLGQLARGFNLTGWLDNVPARPPDQAVLARLRTRGFTHVRLPVTAERLMEAFSSRDAVVRQLLDLDQALGILLDLGFGVSLDLHPGDRLGRVHVADPDRGFELIETVWRLLARRYASRREDRLFFEVLNEPNVRPGVWNSQGPRLVQTIRREAPGRTLIYGPANYQRIDALLELSPLADPNIVYAVHFYDPMIFTHQGLDWSDDPLRYLQGIPFPSRLTDPAIARLLDGLALQGRGDAAALVKKQLATPWTEERITSEIARAAAWAERHQRPVIINEFGVLGWKAASADRARWLRTVRIAAETHCIGWAHWDYADGFGFVRRVGEREIPDEAIVDALLGGRSTARPPR